LQISIGQAEAEGGNCCCCFCHAWFRFFNTVLGDWLATMTYFVLCGMYSLNSVNHALNNIAVCLKILRYEDSTGSTVDENSSVFSLI